MYQLGWLRFINSYIAIIQNHSSLVQKEKEPWGLHSLLVVFASGGFNTDFEIVREFDNRSSQVWHAVIAAVQSILLALPQLLKCRRYMMLYMDICQ